ncbi:MAG TPA: S8 family serine peptidase [candidate division Zixibacteria bacterium]|nr:S8 family serine peptidase [candidate division Zixibacteria bacterium]
MHHTPDPKRLIRTISTGCVLCLLFLAVTALASDGSGNTVLDKGTTKASDPIVTSVYVPGQLVVKFAEDINSVDAVIEGVGMGVAGYLGHSGAYLIYVNDGIDLEQISGQLANQPEVEYAHPNYHFVQLHPVQGSYPFPDEASSGSYHQQPAADLLNLDDAQMSATGAGVTIAVIDGGMKLTHPLFEGKAVSAYDFVDGDIDASDETGGPSSGHGTFVGGVLHLMAPDAELRSYRVININGYGDGFTLARAIEQAVEDGCDVINLSLVLTERHLAVRDAIAYAVSQGVAVFAAAGNENVSDLTYPAAEDGVTAVAAIEDDLTLSDYSNFGNFIDLCAPGSDIYSGYLGTDYAWWSGTSFATPFVTGTAALLIQSDPDITPAALSWILRNTADDIDGVNPTIAGLLGAGLVDPVAALNVAGSGDYATVTPDTLIIEVVQGGQYVYSPMGIAWIQSTNAPADYTYELIEVDSIFANVFPGTGRTNDSVIVMAAEFADEGDYYNIIRFWVDGIVDPVDLVVCQRVVPGTPPDPTAVASPSYFQFIDETGATTPYYGASLISSTNAPAAFSATIVTGSEFLSLITTSGTTNDDSLYFSVDPSLIGTPGSYGGIIEVSVEGISGALGIPITLVISDTTLVGDSAWVMIEPDSIFYLPQGDEVGANGVIHVYSTNAPAPYLIGIYGTESFVMMEEPVGITDEDLDFTVSAEGLEPGWYYDTIKVWVDGVTNTEVDQIITLVVGDDTSENNPLTLWPDIASFNMPAGVDSMLLQPILVSSPNPPTPYLVTVRDDNDFTVMFDSSGYTNENFFVGIVTAASMAPGTYVDTLDFRANGAGDPVPCVLSLVIEENSGGYDSLFVLTPSEVTIYMPEGTDTSLDVSVLVSYPGDPEGYYVEIQGINDLVQLETTTGYTGDYFDFTMVGLSSLTAGIYVDTLAFYLDNDALPDAGPVYCYLQINVSDTTSGGGGTGGDGSAWLDPYWMRFVAYEGDTDIQERTTVIHYADSLAMFIGHVLGGPESFVSLRDTLGTVGDMIFIEVDPTGFMEGLYHDSILFDVEGYEGVLVFEVALAIGADTSQQVTALNNFPNPFNPQTTISFSLAAPGRVQLRIYNVLGQEVATLVDDRLESGQHEFVWNGTSSSGHPVGSGVYFYRLTTDNTTATRKLLLLR